MEQTESRKLEAAKAFDVAALVNYAEGSVVSRTIAQNDAGTVTVFAFDAGQGLSEHSAPYDALVQVIDGQGTFVIGGSGVVLRQGQLVIMPANVPHAVLADQKFKMILTMLRSK